LLNSCSIEIAKHRYSRGWGIRTSKTHYVHTERKYNASIQTKSFAFPLKDTVRGYLVPDTIFLKDSIHHSDSTESYDLSPPVLFNPDTVNSVKSHEQVLEEYRKAKSNLEKISIWTVATFAIALVAVLAAGSIVAGTAGVGIVHLFLFTMAILSLISIYRYIKVFKLLRFLYKEGPSFLDASNPQHEEKLKLRFRMMVNALFIVPLASLFMTIMLHKRLLPEDGYFVTDLNELLRNKAGWYIFYSILLLILWGYLFYLSYPYLFITLLSIL